MAISIATPRTPAAVLKSLLRELDNLDPATVTAKELALLLEEHRSSL